MVRLPAGWHRAAGTWGNGRSGYQPRTNIGIRPAAVPVRHMMTQRQGPIRSDGTGQSFVNGSGAATVQVGPQGLGTRWQMQQAVVATSTGPNDASTVTLYAGQIAIANMIGGQSYAGGGDTIGLAGLELQTGEFLIAVWAGGHPGDAATIRLSGTEFYLA